MTHDADPSSATIAADALSLTDIDDAQASGVGDMSPERFRAAAHATVDVMADYLARVRDFPVLPPVDPGSLRVLFPEAPPDDPEPVATLLDDVVRLIEPNTTHWQHPGFFAYFSTTASGPGILGEMLVAALGANAMLWRTSPVATELEEVVVDWFRRAFDLPAGFDGLLTDTASTSSLIALGAAREAAGVSAAAEGIAGRSDVAAMRVYSSTEAHSSIEKACMTLGLGRAGSRRIATDADLRMDVGALETAIAADRAAGLLPIAIVATLGTTSSTAIDPCPAIADVAAREGLWLHVDAAYGGAVAVCPERRPLLEGWERADSIVVNPHKWLFAPLDVSLLLTGRMPALRDAFSLVPEYLRTLDRERPVHDFNEYTPTLGRRFRALKAWFVIRYFGLAGLRRRIDAHCAWATELAAWVDEEPSFERLAPVSFGTVCLRYRPPAADGGIVDGSDERLDALNERLLNAVNATGEVFLSHTRLAGRFAIRVAIGGLHTERRDVARAWELLRREAARIVA
jgi:aromatic-L-amino-acid/L-tryptophan decarboxylase